jgi:hypothetical protein
MLRTILTSMRRADARPVGTMEIEVEDDGPEPDDEADDDIEIDLDSAKTAN